MATVQELIAVAAERVGVALGAPEYLASPLGDYWCAQTSDGQWYRFSADLFETEHDADVVDRLVAQLVAPSEQRSFADGAR